MNTIWNMINRSDHRHPAKVFPEVEDDEMLFSKNNVCVHPCVASNCTVPRHSLGYLTVTAAPHPALGHTLLLSWRPNQLLLIGGGRRGQRSLSETQPPTAGIQHLAAGDAASRRRWLSDVTHGTGDVTPFSCDVAPSSSCDVTRCNGVAAGSGAEDGVATGSGAEATTDSGAPRPAPRRLELPLGPAARQDQEVRRQEDQEVRLQDQEVRRQDQEVRRQDQEDQEVRRQDQEDQEVRLQDQDDQEVRRQEDQEARLQDQEVRLQDQEDQEARLQDQENQEVCLQDQEDQEARLQDQEDQEVRLQDQEARRRLSIQSAPPSPRPRPPPPSDSPGMFTMDLGQARFVRVFLTPGDPGCGQLVLCSRQSQYRILHFHCGGLDRMVRLFDSWRHLQSAGGNAGDDGGCRLFSVCSPVVEEGEDHHPEEGHYGCLTADVWHQTLTADGRVTDPDQLRQCVFFGGLDPCLRPAVWPLLLGVLSCSDSADERRGQRRRLQREFKRICALPDELSEAEQVEFQRLVVSTVDKDVVRTDPANPFFCGRANPNVQTLRRILLGFAAANPTLGYTQGMSDLLAPLLVTLGSPADAYWALDALIKRSAAVICPRDDVMDVQLGYLRELLRLLTPDFYRHLSAVEDGLELLFTHRWLLLCFKREFAEPAALQIWEACWSCRQTRHFSLFVCAAICAVYAADWTDSTMNADAILLHFTSLSQNMDSEVVLRKARGLLHRFVSLDAVPCTLATLYSGSGSSSGSSGSGGSGGGRPPWHSTREASIVCQGHTIGVRCPAEETAR